MKVYRDGDDWWVAGTVDPLWRQMNDQTDDGYELLRRRPQGVDVAESPDYHAHDAWNIRHVHGDGRVPHVHEMEIRPGKTILLAQSGRADG